MITITGALERITFQNRENHYTIARIKVAEASDSVTVVGHLAGVAVGETLKLKGAWTTHVKYGDQFKVEFYEVLLPATVKGIRTYLGSGIIKGIGKGMAKKIVDHFQEDALDIIENHPRRLREIQGIGRGKAGVITRAWEEHHALRRVMQYLQEHGVGLVHASSILKCYGQDALKILKERPYTIARDIPGAGFEIADLIALKSGMERNDPRRIKACLVYLLLKSESDGHVYAEKDELFRRCGTITSGDDQAMELALGELEDGEEISMDGDAVYLRSLFKAETGISNRIKAMVSIPVASNDLDREAITREVLQRMAVKLSDEQIDVVSQVLNQRVVVITGGPGTGKTTLIRAVCAIFTKLRKKITLSAPTGRAARRLSEVSGKKASTLHRLLLYDQESSSFGRNPVNPLDTDVLVVDEASMVDTRLMFHLLEAIPMTSILILVGDMFQLPSVGPGNVLSDIISSGSVKTFVLTKIFRQAEKSPIIMNAHAVRKGEMPSLKREEGDALSEFYFIENHTPERVVETITALCRSRIKNAFPHVDEIQVLTPMHKGEVGTINLNQQLQKVLNPTGSSIEARGITFRKGDKVMHLKNNYKKDVFNGDIGVVHEISKKDGILTVDYDDRLVDYELLELEELTLAYAVSVHKSQGSEYSAVVVVFTTMHYPLLQRNLLYTALTRGRDLVILVGSRRALEIALENNRTELRLSGLARRLAPLDSL